MRLLILLGIIAIVSAYPPNSLYKGNDTRPLDWWENTVFYQIYPRSFKDGDGDGIGDIKGIISKLDFLVELGVGGTWMSPVFKSPMKDFGYDISDFYSVDPLFGTMEDMDELFRQANAKGVKIILDFVPNHSSDECEWFQKSVQRIEPYTDYYVWRDAKNESGVRKPPNNWGNAFYGSGWEWNEERQQYFFHSFAPFQPDLNFRNPLVVEEMKNVLRFWVKKGAAGFRVDATDHILEDEQFRDEPLSGKTDDPDNYEYTLKNYTRNLDNYPEQVYQWREVLDSLYNETGGYTKILMTETYSSNLVYKRYYETEDGKRQGSHVPLNHILIMNITEYFGATDIKSLIDYALGGVPDGKFASWILGNHDRRRIGSIVGEGKIDAYLTLVMTLPGIAITYQGEELGMLEFRRGLFFNQTFDPQSRVYGEKGQWRYWTRDPVRTPYQWDSSKYAGFSDVKPWLPIHPNYKEVNLEKEKKAKRSTYKYWHQLKELRKNPTLIYGDFNAFVLGSNVLAYERALEGHETFVILLNMGSAEETIDANEVTKGLAEYVEVVLAGAETPYNIGDILPTNAVFLRKFNAVILKSAPEHNRSSANLMQFTSMISLIVLLPIVLRTIC